MIFTTGTSIQCYHLSHFSLSLLTMLKTLLALLLNKGTCSQIDIISRPNVIFVWAAFSSKILNVILPESEIHYTTPNW